MIVTPSARSAPSGGTPPTTAAIPRMEDTHAAPNDSFDHWKSPSHVDERYQFPQGMLQRVMLFACPAPIFLPRSSFYDQFY
jgi:hypothetical protein